MPRAGQAFKGIVMKLVSGMVAAAALFACAGTAQAATYQIKDSAQIDGALVPDGTYTSDTAKDKGPGPYTDYFTFKIDDAYVAGISAAFVEYTKLGSSISSAMLSLYSGAVGSGTLVDSTGTFSPTGPGGVPTLQEASLAGGDYYIEALVTPNKGYGANYSVNVTLGDISSAPEPGAWALMIAGVGLAGAAFRRGRRYRIAGQLA